MAKRGWSRLHVTVAIVWVIALLSGWAAWRHHATGTGPFATDGVSMQSSSATPSVRRQPHLPRIDMYGNDVEDAYAEYRVRVDGDMYERHSPRSAMPRPGRPEM